MSCDGRGSDFGGGCSSPGADFGDSSVGGMGTSHDTHFPTTSAFSSHPTSSTTQWTSSTVSGVRQSSTATNSCGVVFVVVFFMVWFGSLGFMAYMAATNISPFLAFPPICMAVLGFFCFISVVHRNAKRRRGPNINLNTCIYTQSQTHPPPQQRGNLQQGVPPHSGHPASYPTQQPQWNPAYATNYRQQQYGMFGQQQHGMAGQQAPRPTAPTFQVPEEDNPPSYDDVVKGGTVPLGIV